jgi:hypothetical protein
MTWVNSASALPVARSVNEKMIDVGVESAWQFSCSRALTLSIASSSRAAAVPY